MFPTPDPDGSNEDEGTEDGRYRGRDYRYIFDQLDVSLLPRLTAKEGVTGRTVVSRVSNSNGGGVVLSPIVDRFPSCSCKVPS
jgi:hypothetical protein